MPRARSRAPLPSSARVRKLILHFFLDNPQNDPMISLSLFILTKLSFFLPSRLQKTTDPPRSRRSPRPSFLPRLSGTFLRVFFILFYPFVRSSFGKHNRSSVFRTQFPKEEEDKNYTLCSFSFFLRKTVQIERVLEKREQSESVADKLFLCICLLSIALFTQTAKETSSNKNPANPSPPPRCRRWKSPKSPTPPRKSGTSPPLCSVAPSSVWRSVSCY